MHNLSTAPHKTDLPACLPAFVPVPLLPQTPIPSSLTPAAPQDVTEESAGLDQPSNMFLKQLGEELNTHFLGQLPIAKWNRCAVNPDSKPKSNKLTI